VVTGPLVKLGVVAAAALPAGVGVQLAERWASTEGLTRVRDRLATELRTDDVVVDVPARPLLSALLRSPGTPVHVRANDVPVGDDSRLRELVTEIDDVRIDLRSRHLTSGAGTFTAVIAEAELTRLLRLPGVISRLELRAGGLRVWTALAVPLDAEILVRDGALRVLPDPAQLGRLLDRPGLGAFRRALEGSGLRLGLPALPLDAQVGDLAFEAGTVTVTGTGPPQRLPLRSNPRQRSR
jgi:hypothetical protein